MKTISIALLAILSIGCGEKSVNSIENAHSETKTTEIVDALQSTSTGIPAPTDVANIPAYAQKTDSGLAYKMLKKGFGTEHPTEKSTVEVHYTGWTTDGKMFDSSAQRGFPATFPLDRVIEGWTEGLQLMTVGEKTRFWIPEDIAYKGLSGRPAGMLVFDIELLSMTTPPPPPARPIHIAKAPPDALRTASGLAYKMLTAGTGTENPVERSVVEVHYTGWTSDGELFDSSVLRGTPATFPLNQVISGWTEGLQLMTVGQKARFWIPQELAYQGRPGAPAGMLVFDIELLSMTTSPAPPETPIDVAAAPVNAQRTISGLAYKVLKKGSGRTHPTAYSEISVHYTGWTSDGELFDSSVVRGSPITVPLNQVITGWTEGVQLMTVGEKTRFWIPQELAYQGRPGAPAGMLVFDIELLEVTP